MLTDGKETKIQLDPLERDQRNPATLHNLANIQPAGGHYISNCTSSCLSSIFVVFIWIVSLLVSLILWPFFFVTLNDYEKAVLFRFGKYIGERDAGYHYFFPFIDSWRVVDMRLKTMDIVKQEMLTKESVTVMINAVVYYQIEKPKVNVLTIEKADYATSQLAATSVRSVIGMCELDDLLSKRDKINSKLQQILDEETDCWGLKVTRVEIKDVTLPKQMQRSMGAQAESERIRRAKVIAAEGERQAAPLLLEAAKMLSQNVAALQLRFLDTLREISAEKNSTVVFPLPLEFLKVFQKERREEAKVPFILDSKE